MTYPPQPDYGQPYGPQGYAPPPVKTNGLAIASLVLGLTGFVTCGFTSILAVVFGHVALGQIRRDRTDGHGMAVAGTVLGWLLTAAWIAYWGLVVSGVVAGIAGIGTQAAIGTPGSAREQLHVTQPGTSQSPAAGGGHTVVFEATGRGGAVSAGNITYSVDLTLKQESGVPLPYSRQVPVDGQVPRLYLWVQNAGDHGSVTCRIKVDGRTVREATISTAYGVCTVSADTS